MDFVKALVPGSLLTFVISMILGSNHSKGAWLNIFRIVYLASPNELSAIYDDLVAYARHFVSTH